MVPQQQMAPQEQMAPLQKTIITEFRFSDTPPSEQLNAQEAHFRMSILSNLRYKSR